MKSYLTSIVVILILPYSLMAQSHFLGPMRLKGERDGKLFTSQDFNIKLDGHYKILRLDKGSKEFVVKFDNNSIYDVVFSSNRSAAAAVTTASEWKKHKRKLVTIDRSGKKRVFEYQSYEMTKRLGWIVELGAVSDDGKLVLAKCALMLPPNEKNMRHVRHEWTVIEINDGSIKILESMDAINKWHMKRVDK